MGNGKDSGKDTGADSGSEMEVDAFFHEDDNPTDGKALNRIELMKLTGRELAKMAQPYSTKTLKVLEKTAKPKLCDLILAQGKNNSQEEKVATPRAGAAKSETENFISMAVNMLDMIKQSRDNEPLNAMAKDTFTKQAVVYADKKVSQDEMNIDTANTALFVISAGALLFDGVIGFKNAPTLLGKLKNKFFKKEDKKES